MSNVVVSSSSPRYYVWHWHLKHELDNRSQAELSRIPIHGLFYRVGHFSAAGGHPSVKRLKKSFRFPDQFKNLKSFKEIHLVYTFANSSIDAFVKNQLNLIPDEIIPWIIEVIKEDFVLFRELNQKVRGVQIDLEGKHINFEIFQRLMADLRKELPGALLSITPMSSWHKKKGIRKVLDNVDMVVPMLYDYKRSNFSNQPLKVSDWEWLPEMANNWEKLGKPVIFGIPTYSYCIVYDENNRLKIPWALVSPDTASENRFLGKPNLIFNKSRKSGLFSRDRVIEYEVPDRWQFSNRTFRKGSKLKYNFVSSSALAQMLNAIEKKRGKFGLGYAFFRFGIPGEALVLDAWRIRRAVEGRLGRGYKLNIRKIKYPSGEVYQIQNQGAPSYFGKTGLTLNFSGCRSKILNASDFDRASQTFDTLNLHEDYLKAHELLFTPTMICDEGSRLRVIFNDAGGVSRQSEIDLTNLDQWIVKD